jgi:GT2 family glycosyltransferase
MLSVLIVSWNTRQLLSNCLRSIAQYPPDRKYEVIVVDNASHDGSAEMVRIDFPWARLVEAGKNLGYAAGNNLAFGLATGDLLLTLNPDTEFRDAALEAACRRLEDAPDYGSLAIRQRGMDGNTQRSIRGFPTVLNLATDLLGFTRLFPEADTYFLRRFDYHREQACPQPMATFTLFRRTALAKVGSVDTPFDPRFPIFFNDVDLMYRLHLAGEKCLYFPEATVWHHGGEGTRQVKKSMIWESHRCLMRYLWKHHAGGLAPLALFPLSLVVYLAAFVRAKGYHAGFQN